MIDEGADPIQVIRRMGHSDIRAIHNLYGHLFPDREDDLVAKVDERYSLAVKANALSRPIRSVGLPGLINKN
jgi:hypothetical protein